MLDPSSVDHLIKVMVSAAVNNVKKISTPADRKIRFEFENQDDLVKFVKEGISEIPDFTVVSGNWIEIFY